jgi:hypothetical protein
LPPKKTARQWDQEHSDLDIHVGKNDIIFSSETDVRGYLFSLGKENANKKVIIIVKEP